LATQTLNRLASIDGRKIAILGIGNELNGDDGIGIRIASELTKLDPENVLLEGDKTNLILAAGLAPENFTGQIRRFHPDIVIMIDAAEMGCEPGCVQWLPWEQIIGISSSTHCLPLSIIAQYLVAEVGCEVYVLAIQAKTNEFAQNLSTPVAGAADEVVRALGDLLFTRV
jgi:hydrogenase 3 maturation protease